MTMNRTQIAEGLPHSRGLLRILRRRASLAFATLSLAGCAANSRTAAQLEAGAGTYQVNIDGFADDSTDAGLFGFSFETIPRTKVGGGARVRGISSNDDLEYPVNTPFGPVTLSDGQASQGDWFLHATYDSGDERTRLPFRFGMGVRSFEVESVTQGNSLSWSSVGPHVEFAPRLPLNRSESSTLSFQGLLGLGYGLTTIEASGTSEQWDSTAVFFDFGVGLGATFEKVYFDVGYRYLSSRYAEGDLEAAAPVPETEASFSGVVFTFGARF
jgi:hypothetical protein